MKCDPGLRFCPYRDVGYLPSRYHKTHLIYPVFLVLGEPNAILRILACGILPLPLVRLMPLASSSTPARSPTLRADARTGQRRARHALPTMAAVLLLCGAQLASVQGASRSRTNFTPQFHAPIFHAMAAGCRAAMPMCPNKYPRTDRPTVLGEMPMRFDEPAHARIALIVPPIQGSRQGAMAVTFTSGGLMRFGTKFALVGQLPAQSPRDRSKFERWS